MNVPCCPACGQLLLVAPLGALKAACSPQQARIVDLIATQPGLSADAIAAMLRVTGIGTQLRRIRERLAPLGWTVEAREGLRRGYRLAPLPHPSVPGSPA